MPHTSYPYDESDRLRHRVMLTSRDDFLGLSPAVQRVDEDINCAARSDAKVLITGETGAGKEVAARLIHHRGLRSSRPLVVVNCAGLPDSLLESELFGHVRGSFTGAYRDKQGLVETAHTGTIFLDEVGEMSARMQAVLLRFLETGEIQRVGSDRAHSRVDVRVITATNRDLQARIKAGAFREDLYYRLNVIQLVIPPLRERREDIPLLIEHFLEKFSAHHRMPRPQVSPQALQMLVEHSWPGNVRELKNVIERLILKTNGQLIKPVDLRSETLKSGEFPSRSVDGRTGPPHDYSLAAQLAAQVLEGGESFWAVVYPVFKAHDLTRDDLRKIVQIGLQKSTGNYKQLSELFNMPPGDYKRFLSFLRKHDCHLSVQRFRTADASLRVAPADEGAA
jgi:transcriptional regulator with PAS, ATPase and Fis domain